MSGPWEEFAPAANAAEGPWSEFSGEAEKPKKNSIARGIADLGIGFVSGAAGATKAIADAAGAGNAVSNVADDINKEVTSYLSDSAKADQQKQADIIKSAEGGSTWDGIKAGAKAFGVAPAQTAVAGLGSVVPVVAGSALTALTGGSAPVVLATGAGVGLTMGAGTVKGAIYDEVKQRSMDAGMGEGEAIAAATKAQEYGGDNAGNIALGAGLGVADAATGVTKAASNIVRNAIVKPAATEAAKAATRGIIGRTAAGMAGEIPLEAAQGGQEKYAANVAAQRAGYDVDAWSGVASQATLEALASAGPGAAFGAFSGSKYAESKRAPAEDPKAEEQPAIAGLLPSPTYTGTPGDQLVANDAERQAAIDAADANAAALYAAREAFEQQLRKSVTVINEPAPLQQRIDDMLAVDTRTMSKSERASYEKDLAAAFGEQVGIRHDANQNEVPFTMGEYLDAQVAAENAVRARPLKQNAAQQADSRLQQLAEEEVMQQADIAQPASGIAAMPSIPVNGPLSKAANEAIQSGAAVIAPAVQPAAPVAAAQATSAGPLAKAASEAAPNIPATVAPAAPNIQDQAPNIEQAQAATSEIDLTGRNEMQLNYLAKNGKTGYKEAAIAELQRRGVSAAPSAIPNGDGVTNAPDVAPINGGDIKQAAGKKGESASTEDSIGWTRMTTVEREGLLIRAGYGGTGNRRLNLGGAGALNRAWDKMGNGLREKLVAAHEARFNQTSIKSEAPGAATVQAEPVAQDQNQIKKQDQATDTELPPNFDPGVTYAKRQDGSYKTKGEYTPEEWSAYTKSAIDNKLSKPATRQNKGPAGRDDLVGAILRITGGKGIASKMSPTIIGDTANNATKVRGLFTNDGTFDLDDTAELLRTEEGFDVRDGNHLSELIREQASGERIYSMERTEREATDGAEKQHRDEVRKQAKKLGVKTVARKFSAIEEEVFRRMEQRHNEAVAKLDARAKSRFDAMLRHAVDVADYDEVDAIIADAQSRFIGREFYGQATKQLRGYIDDLTIERQEQEQTNATIEEQQGTSAEPDWLKDDGFGTEGSGIGGTAVAAPEEARIESGQQGRAETGLTLEGQTNEQAAEQFAQQQAAKAKEAADKKAADEKAKADSEANDFRLAGSDRAADVAVAGGQVGLFGANGQPTKDAAQQSQQTTAANENKEPNPSAKEPWQMTRDQWNTARESVRPNVAQSKFTKSSSSEAVGNNERLQSLLYGVSDDARSKLNAATKGEIKLSEEETAALLERINSRVTHRDVIEKAVSEGKPVPPDVLAEYDDLAPGGSLSQPKTDAAPKSSKDKEKQSTSEMDAAKASDSKAADKADAIGDFGEKIGGAKKDLWTGYKDKLAGAESLDIKAEPLSKSWPAPDYEALIESGVDSFVVAFVRAARDSIPRKPTASWKVKSWAGGVELLRDMSKSLINGNISAAQAKEMLQKAGDVSRGMRGIAGRIELYQLVGHRQSLDGISLSNHFYSIYKGKENVNLWSVEKEAKATAFSNMPAEIATGSTKQEALEKFKAIYDKVDFNKKADRAVTFDLYSQAGKFYVGKKMGRNITQLAGPFDTIKETRAYRDENHDELVSRLEKAKEIPKPRRDRNEPRVGEDMRDGQNVTPEMFAESFGFKGVEFGNWVEQKKRQKDLNESFDALMDMAAILGVPPKALSLNGELGLAFGARGQGGIDSASAHYERDFVVINMIKKEGAGSLGHEWFHALDNYFSRLRGKGSDMMTEALDVSLAGRGSDFIANTAVRREMILAFGRVVNAIKTTALRERSAKLDNKRSKAYWTTTPEMSARAFESYLISKLQDQNASNDYLANIVDDKTWKAAESLGFELDDSYPYPTAGEMPMIREAFDKFFQVVETKETERGTALYNVAATGTISIADKAIYGMAAEGKSAAEILRFIASASRSPFNRQLAKLLMKTGIAPSIEAGDSKGWKFNAGEGNRYAAAYNPKTDSVALFRPAAAERNVLHEMVHAATLKALAKRGMASGQMAVLFAHVKKTGKLKGMYGMSDIDEFVAEAFTNPKFQEALKKIDAPMSSRTLSSAWQWFIRTVRGILGLPADQENALSQALDIGLAVMRDDMALRKEQSPAADIPFAEISGKEIDKVLGRTIQEKARNWMKINLQGKSFKNEMTGWDISVSSKGIGKTMMHAAKEIHSRSVAAIPDLLKNAVLVASEANRLEKERADIPLVHHFYAPMSVAGRQYVARIVVKEAKDGTRFYDYDTSNEINPAESMFAGEHLPKEESASTPSLSKKGAAASSAGLSMSMAKLMSYVKAEHGGTDPKFIRYNVADEGAWSVSEPSKMDDVIYSLQDKHVDTRRVVQAIAKTGKEISDKSNPYLQEELFHGRAAKGVKDFLDFELRPLLAKMQLAKIDMGDFEEYLWNRHAEERNKQIAKINPEMKDGGSGIKTADARAFLAGIDANKRSVLESLAQMVDGMNKSSQRVLVESGLETQETIDAWNGAYKHYVPLQREDVDSGNVGTGKGFSIRGSSTKRAMGSGRAVVDIIANLTMQRERNIVRAEKNRVSNALLGLAVKNPNPDFWTVDKAPKERVVEEKAIYTVTDDAGNATEFTRMDDAEKFARSLPGAEIEQTWGDRVTERIVPGFSTRDNVLLTRINGKDHYITFNERDERAMRMVQSLKNLDADNMGRVLSIVGKATRYLASINTQYNPVFGVINLIRDAQGALINLSSTPLAGDQKRVFGYTLDALRGIYADIRAHRKGNKPSSSWAKLFEEFQNEGGQTGYRDQYANAEQRAEAIRSELDQFKEGKVKQLTRGVFGWLSDYNETMENAVRLATYKAAKERGLSNQKAASLAKNITVNFNRKGQMATQVGALYAFFNASVQGSARLAETLFESKDGDIKTAKLSKAGKKIVMGGIMLGSMQALLLAAAGFGDDEPPEFVRERNLILPIGDGKYLTLAMPLGFHVIPGIGRIATEFVMGGGKDPIKHMAAFAGMFAESFNPIGSSGFSLQTITPSVVDPFAALAENRDFTGKEIYRKDFNALNPTPGHMRAKDVATFYSRWISEGLNFITGGTEFKPGMISWSPDSIDYLVAQAGGGVMREANKVFQTAGATYSGEDLPLYKIPLAGRFIGDTEGQSGQSAKFYDAIKKINMHEAEYKGLLKDGRRQEAMDYLAENPGVKLIMAGNHVESQVRKLRSMKREMVEKDAGADQVREIDARITATMKKFNERAASVTGGQI